MSLPLAACHWRFARQCFPLEPIRKISKLRCFAADTGGPAASGTQCTSGGEKTLLQYVVFREYKGPWPPPGEAWLPFGREGF